MAEEMANDNEGEFREQRVYHSADDGKFLWESNSVHEVNEIKAY